MIRKNYSMPDRKQSAFKTPDISKMQEVVIDRRTKIYIAKGDDPLEARDRYIAKLESRGKVFTGGRT